MVDRHRPWERNVPQPSILMVSKTCPSRYPWLQNHLSATIAALVAHLQRRLPESMFGRLCLMSAALHVVAAFAFHAIEPPPYYGWDASHEQVHRLREPDPRPFLSPEPRLPVVWSVDVNLTDTLRLRTFNSIDSVTQRDLQQVYKWSLDLFPAYAGREKKRVGALDLRVLPVSLLNNPLYFDVDAEGGTLYGLYYSRLNVAYVTDEVVAHPEHLVHELAHHLFDEYKIHYDDELEEVRARHFEGFFRRFLSHLASNHVDTERPPEIPHWMDASTVYFLDQGVTVRSKMPLTRERIEWIRKLSRVATSVLPTYTGRFSERLDGIEIRVVSKRFLSSAERFPDGNPSIHGRYYPAHGLLYVTQRAFENADLLGHFFAHHFLRRSQLSMEEREMICHCFGYELDRRMLPKLAARGTN